MTRRMSVSLTLDAVHAHTKTVTRRRADTWKTLHAGDFLTLIEKGMGLPKGTRQVVVATVQVVDVRVEPLDAVRREENATAREGLPEMSAPGFIEFWMRSHGYNPADHPTSIPCRRIEWRYIEAT